MSFYERLKYPRRYGYYNSGVLLVNLRYWREHDVVKVFNSFMRNHRSDIRYWDQDVLNADFYNKKVVLPIKYNLAISFFSLWAHYDRQKYDDEILEASKDPIIIHYTPDKPWKYNRFPIPFESSFLKYQSQTRWRDLPIDDRRPRLLRLRHAVADTMRKLKLWPKLPQVFVKTLPVD